MSGGVDSSVSAVLLLEAGYEVIGAFLKNWGDKQDVTNLRKVQNYENTKGTKSTGCTWREDRRDAMRVAAQLGIELITFDFEDEYRAQVYEYMLDEYKAGRTPNPDVLCNKYMKFGLLMREAEKLGCEYVATGHYARVQIDDEGQAHLLVGVDQNKDQSYFLCQLNQDQLKHALFPIGELKKSKVRQIAKDHNLAVAEKKDSQGICFVGQVDLVDFLRERIPEREGDIITTDGEVIGQHKGHQFYTIGQRTGLGLGGGTPYFVVERRAETNEIVVAQGEDDPALFSSELRATNISETVLGNLNNYFAQPIKCRIRYRQPLQDCTIDHDGAGTIKVVFTEPQRAVAPGQFVAFYVGEELIGSGVIT